MVGKVPVRADGVVVERDDLREVSGDAEGGGMRAVASEKRILRCAQDDNIVLL